MHMCVCFVHAGLICTALCVLCVTCMWCGAAQSGWCYDVLSHTQTQRVKHATDSMALAVSSCMSNTGGCLTTGLTCAGMASAASS